MQQMLNINSPCSWMWNDFSHSQYTFGDMIAFPKKINCICKEVIYKHYAIYVGNKTFEGLQKAPDEDIFHYTGMSTLKLLTEKWW